MEVFTHTLFIQSIAETSSHIIHMIENCFVLDDIKSFLQKEDIKTKIEFMDSFIKGIKGKKKVKCISIILNKINENISAIHKILTQLKKKIEDHKQKYFYNYRNLCANEEKKNIVLESTLMMQRFEMMVRALHVYT